MDQHHITEVNVVADQDIGRDRVLLGWGGGEGGGVHSCYGACWDGFPFATVFSMILQ